MATQENQTDDVPREFRELPREQKVAYVQKLWQAIGEKNELNMPEWHSEIVSHRRKTADTRDGKSWNDVRDRLLQKYSD